MTPIKISKNNLFFVFIIFGYIFGVMLYDFIEFKYTDELMTAFLVLFASLILWERRDWKQAKPLYILGGIFVFYIIYSFIIKSNIPKAILMDVAIQVKPFLSFLCVLLLRPQLKKQHKLIITLLCLLGTCLLLVVAFLGYQEVFFGHTSRFASAAVITAILYLYCSSYRWTDIFFFLFILAISILSTRSKAYGFLIICICLVYFIKQNIPLKFNIKTIILVTFAFALVIASSWEKIYLYYIQGVFDSKEMWSRPVMFIYSSYIIIDYFPFGTGLGSFGTYASALFYSPVYKEYGINHIWGLSQEMPDFIVDAYYPELAQFGIVGVLLYLFFWRYALKSIKGYDKNLYGKYILIVYLVFFFFLIEGVADSTFVQNRGLVMLIIMALSITEAHQLEQPEINKMTQNDDEE